jgi:hypothetical protein
MFIVLLATACQSLPSTAPVADRQANDQSTTATALAEPGELPNILVLTNANNANVAVRRRGGAFLPATLGTELAPGDLVQVKAGEAAIFCGAEANWESSPLPLTVGQDAGIPCGAGRPPRLYPHLSTLLLASRGITTATVAAPTLLVLSPRSGWVIDNRPPLVWQEIASATSYTVTLESDDSQKRPPVLADSSPLPYPATWPPLEGLGASYQVVITASNGVESDPETPGFSLLEEPAPLQAKIERLRQRPLPEPALTILLAELYLRANLRSETVALLTALPDADQLAAVQQLLGETYLHMGLLDQSAAAYTRLLTLAQEQGLIEAEAAAHVGLGYASCARSQPEQGKEHWSQAHVLYQQIPISARADEVADLITQADQECK